MRRGRSTGNPTKAQAARHADIRAHGCIVAILRGVVSGNVERDDVMACAIHHLTVGGKHGAKRRGHDFVLGLNDWSHQGRVLTEYGWDADECERRLGPSYALTPAAFRREIGSDAFLEWVQDCVLRGDFDAVRQAAQARAA